MLYPRPETSANGGERMLQQQGKGTTTSASPAEGDAPPPKPTPLDISIILALLVDLVLTTYTSQRLVQPFFGKTIDTMTFQAGMFISFLLFSFILINSESSQSKVLGIIPLLQVISAMASRPLASFVADRLHSDPMVAALLVHIVLNFPIIGHAGGVWLQRVVSLSTLSSDRITLIHAFRRADIWSRK